MSLFHWKLPRLVCELRWLNNSKYKSVCVSVDDNLPVTHADVKCQDIILMCTDETGRSKSEFSIYIPNVWDTLATRLT